jgi:predicted patatin/cPLA2 family phospholipase
MSIAIAVEGGGLRGAFAVGALQQLAAVLERPVAHLLATSSGAPNAAYFATGQIADGVRIWEQRTHGSQLVDFANLVHPHAPVMKIDELVSVFRNDIPLDAARLQTSQTTVHIAVTEVHSGRGQVIRATPDNVFSLLQAAMAIPFAYGKIVNVEDGSYIDGGFHAPLPIREALELEPRRLLAILTKPRGHRRRKNTFVEWLACRSYRDYPNAREAIRGKWMHYNATMELIDQLEAAGRVLVIRPDADLPVSRMSRSKTRILASIELGREVVRCRAAELLRFVDG